MSRFINTELKSDSESDSDSSNLIQKKQGTKFDAELMAKLEKSDSDQQ